VVRGRNNIKYRKVNFFSPGPIHLQENSLKCWNAGTIVICYLLFRKGEGTQAAVEPGL
jgi:hypothetical protein